MSANLNKLHLAVKEQTANFKIHFMNLAKISIIKEYRSLPSKIEELKSMLNDVYSKEIEIGKNYLDSNGHIISMKLFNEAAPKMRPLLKERDKLRTAINRCEKLIAFSEENYVANELNKAEIMFDGKVLGLADRLDKKLFSPDDLQFSNISSDPKLFNVYTTSGNQKVYARSVLAAVNSECMVAHFRFIITNAK